MNADKRPSSGSGFGAFLDALEAEQRPAPRLRIGRSDPRFLRALATGPKAVGELLAQSGLDVLQFAETLKSAREADLVELSADAVTVKLTPLGKQIVAVDTA